MRLNIFRTNTHQDSTSFITPSLLMKKENGRKYLSNPAVGYAKLDWRLGLQVEVKSP